MSLHSRPLVRKRDEKHHIRLKKMFRRALIQLTRDYDALVNLTRPIMKHVANVTTPRFEPKNEKHEAEMSLQLTMMEDQLIGDVPRRFRDPWVWMRNWDRGHIIDHQHFEDGDYRAGFQPVRPHPDYANISTGQTFTERNWADGGSSDRELISAGSGYAVLVPDFEEVLRLVNGVISRNPVGSFTGLANRLGSLKRILAYSFFPVTFDEELGGFLTNSFGDFVQNHGFHFQLERLSAIQSK
jgi:hypothetical protein